MGAKITVPSFEVKRRPIAQKTPYISLPCVDIDRVKMRGMVCQTQEDELGKRRSRRSNINWRGELVELLET
jgi:hypothetical protein